MVQWFRARSSGLAASVLLVLVSLSASTALPHADDCHGDVCVQATGPHSAESHRVGAPSSHEPHEHCAVCHWARAFRHSVPSAPGVVALVEQDVRIHAPVLAAPLVFPAAQPPLRSPPSAPALV